MWISNTSVAIPRSSRMKLYPRLASEKVVSDCRKRRCGSRGAPGTETNSVPPESHLDHAGAPVADRLQQVRIRFKRLVELDGPGAGVGFRVVDRDFDFESAEIQPPEAFCDLGHLRDRSAHFISP